MSFSERIPHPKRRPAPLSIRPALPRGPQFDAPARDPLWLPVVALVVGLLAAVAVFSPLPWTGLQRLATTPLAAAAVALGCLAVARQERGQALALAGVVLGAASLMGATAAPVL